MAYTINFSDAINKGTITINDNTLPSFTISYPTSSVSMPEYDALTVQWSGTDNFGLSEHIHLFTLEYSNDGNQLSVPYSRPDNITNAINYEIESR